MTLTDYLRREAISLEELARRAGLAPSTLYRLLHGQLMPGRKTVVAIERATAGAVTYAGLAESVGARRRDT